MSNGPPFDTTPEFKHFTEVMRGVISLSKKRLDELVKASKEASPRNGDQKAPGRKRNLRKRST